MSVCSAPSPTGGAVNAVLDVTAWAHLVGLQLRQKSKSDSKETDSQWNNTSGGEWLEGNKGLKWGILKRTSETALVACLSRARDQGWDLEKWREVTAGRGSEKHSRGNGMDHPGSEKKGARVRNWERGGAVRWRRRVGATACQASSRPRRKPRDVGCGFYSVPSGFQAEWEMIGIGQHDSKEMCYRQVLGSRWQTGPAQGGEGPVQGEARQKLCFPSPSSHILSLFLWQPLPRPAPANLLRTGKREGQSGREKEGGRKMLWGAESDFLRNQFQAFLHPLPWDLTVGQGQTAPPKMTLANLLFQNSR